jgi:glycerophosphoryl diester phosphodiesterase
LVITAADSDAGGLQIYQYLPYTRPSGSYTSSPSLPTEGEPQVPFINANPTTTNTTRNFLDGVTGSTASESSLWKPFVAKDSLDGEMGNFAVGWAGTPDFPGSIVSKAYGMNADYLPSTLDNTEIYRLMYQTLFGVRLSDLPKTRPGNDALLGTAANDLLRGGEGNDFLVGAQGADILVGGAGDDLFYIDAGKGTDTILDFVKGEDKIAHPSTVTPADLTIVQGTGNQSADTFISLKGSGELLAILSGVQASTLGVSDFIPIKLG